MVFVRVSHVSIRRVRVRVIGAVSVAVIVSTGFGVIVVVRELADFMAFAGAKECQEGG